MRSGASRYIRQNVLGLVAIFLALNAGAYAVSREPAKPVVNADLATGSVDARTLASGAVEGRDIHSAAVGPKKIKLDKLVKYLQTRVNGACPDGQLVQSIAADGSVICAAAGAGTITGVTTSDGLTGGGNEGNVDLGIDPSAIQSRVTGTCAGNEAIQSIGENGGVGCQAITANGAAGGELSGTYPNPSLGAGSVDASNIATLPHGKIVQTVTGGPPAECPQSIASDGAFHRVEFDTLRPGSAGVTFNDANDTLTVTTGGTYLVSGYVNWSQNGTGSRGIELLSNGARELAWDGRDGAADVNTGQTAGGLVTLAGGQTLSLSAGQSSGGPLALADPFGSAGVASEGCANLSVQWIGP